MERPVCPKNRVYYSGRPIDPDNPPFDYRFPRVTTFFVLLAMFFGMYSFWHMLLK